MALNCVRASSRFSGSVRVLSLVYVVACLGLLVLRCVYHVGCVSCWW